jgi:hypothetical protein
VRGEAWPDKRRVMGILLKRFISALPRSRGEREVRVGIRASVVGARRLDRAERTTAEILRNSPDHLPQFLMRLSPTISKVLCRSTMTVWMLLPAALR